MLLRCSNAIAFEVLQYFVVVGNFQCHPKDNDWRFVDESQKLRDRVHRWPVRDSGDFLQDTVGTPPFFQYYHAVSLLAAHDTQVLLCSPV